MKSLTRIFVNGLIAVLPIGATIAILYWLGKTAEQVFSPLLKPVLESLHVEYRWGMGILAGLLIVFCIGVLVNAYLVRQVFEWGESLLARLPLIKTIYQPMRDLMQFFSSSETKKTGQVVMVNLLDGKLRFMGFLMRENLSDLPSEATSENAVAVYLPMSYQLGGFTALIPRAAIQPIDMSTEDGMRFVLTAGVGKEEPAQTSAPE